MNQSINQFLEHNQEAILRLCLRKKDTLPNALELAHRVNIRFFNAYIKNPNIRLGLGYVYKIIDTTVIDDSRKMKNRKTYLYDTVQLQRMSTIADNSLKESIEDGVVDFERIFECCGLTKKERWIVNLRLQGLKFDEISKTNNINQQTLASMMRRAIAKLKKNITKQNIHLFITPFLFQSTKS